MGKYFVIGLIYYFSVLYMLFFNFFNYFFSKVVVFCAKSGVTFFEVDWEKIWKVAIKNSTFGYYQEFSSLYQRERVSERPRYPLSGLFSCLLQR